MVEFGSVTASVTTVDLTVDLRDVRAGVADEPPTATRLRPGAAVDGFLFRLCLDLQVDTLLISLGAAAADRRRPGVGLGPWRQWLEEDVDLTCLLGEDVLAEHGTLPAVLGDGREPGSPAILVDHLISRFEAMQELLEAMAADRSATAQDPRSARVSKALRHCRMRLEDLRVYRHEVDPEVTLRASSCLPGEMLGPG